MGRATPAERLGKREIGYQEYLHELQKPQMRVLERAEKVVEKIERTLRDAGAGQPSRH